MGDYLPVKPAAEVLKVCSSTLRNRDRAGKLKPYRLHGCNELEARLRSVGEERQDG